jgi:hypothetical protein
MPQSTFTTSERWWWGTRTHTDSGVSLEDLVVDGDAKGGRYVSGVVDLVVGQR